MAASHVRALYTFAGDPASHTPAFAKDEVMKLIKKHDTGWLEIELENGTRGYVSPAWVEECAPPKPPAAALPEVPNQPPFAPPPVPTDEEPALSPTEATPLSPSVQVAQAHQEESSTDAPVPDEPGPTHAPSPPPEVDSPAEPPAEPPTAQPEEQPAEPDEPQGRIESEPDSPDPDEEPPTQDPAPVAEPEPEPTAPAPGSGDAPAKAQAPPVATRPKPSRPVPSKRISSEFSDQLAAKIGLGPPPPKRPPPPSSPRTAHRELPGEEEEQPQDCAPNPGM